MGDLHAHLLHLPVLSDWTLALCIGQPPHVGSELEAPSFETLHVPFYHAQGISLVGATKAESEDLQIQDHILPMYYVVHILQVDVCSIEYDDVSYHGENGQFPIAHMSPPVIIIVISCLLIIN